MSTVSPETSKKLSEEHRARGAVYLAAPVSGRPEGAAAAKLFIFLAGEAKAKERVKPILELLGQRIFDLGTDAEKANLFKLIGNSLILSAIQTLSEGFTLAEKNGLPPKLVGEVLTDSIFACPVYKIYAPLLAEGKFEPAGFSLELGFKDTRLLQEVAKNSSVPMPISDLLYEKLSTCMSRGDEKKDWSCIASLCKEAADLKSNQPERI
jgi:3-hydroxyisobutyrate dehydrogenase-like beta-hydroxyacid dehydrogenase